MRLLDAIFGLGLRLRWLTFIDGWCFKCWQVRSIGVLFVIVLNLTGLGRAWAAETNSYSLDAPLQDNSIQEMPPAIVVAWVGQTQMPDSLSLDRVLARHESPNSTLPSLPTVQVSVYQQVILYIDVATPRWFKGGTKIAPVEIDNVIAKQRSLLATNYTQRINGKTWTRQRWEVTLYPQVSGQFVIPPITVQVEIAGRDNQSIQGQLYTRPISFQAVVPNGLIDPNTQWFSATDVTASQDWVLSQPDLKVGDSITRTVKVTAKDTLSILLPDLFEKDAELSDFQVYRSPPILEDRQSRGDYQSTRVDSHVYIVQQGGEVWLPDLTMQWWDPSTQTVQSLVMTGRHFKVTHTVYSWVRYYAQQLVISAIAMVVLLLLFFMARRYYQTHPAPAWWQFRVLLRSRKWGEARAMLYRQLRRRERGLQLRDVEKRTCWQQQCEQLMQPEPKPRLFISMWRRVMKRRSIRTPFHRLRDRWLALPDLQRLPSNKQYASNKQCASSKKRRY